MSASEPKTKYDGPDKIEIGIERQMTSDEMTKTQVLDDDEGEVFKSHTGHAEYRALGW